MRIQGAASLLRGALRAAGSGSGQELFSRGPAAFILSRGFADSSELKKTVLYDLHVSSGGMNRQSLIRFACWSLGTTKWFFYRQDGSFRGLVNANTVQG